MRVVLDSNVFIAALLAPKGAAATLLGLWREQLFTLLYSTELILELRDVLSRPVFVKRIKRHRNTSAKIFRLESLYRLFPLVYYLLAEVRV